jgi:hypothetical protein
MYKRGRGRPRYSRPGGRRYIRVITISLGHSTSLHGALPQLWMRPMLITSCTELLRQVQLALYVEGLGKHRDAGVRLAAAY